MKVLSSLPIFIVALVLSGCGGGSDDASDNGPLDGREVKRASQLEGTWLGVNQGDFVGFEFMDDGKVLATPVTAAISGGAMYSYDVLDGGRLSLMAPNGQTIIYKVTIAGDRMELQGSMMLSSTNSQRFRRLPKGQTLEQGIEEQEKLDAAAYRDELQKLKPAN